MNQKDFTASFQEEEESNSITSEGHSDSDHTQDFNLILTIIEDSITITITRTTKGLDEILSREHIHRITVTIEEVLIINSHHHLIKIHHQRILHISQEIQDKVIDQEPDQEHLMKINVDEEEEINNANNLVIILMKSEKINRTTIKHTRIND